MGRGAEADEQVAACLALLERRAPRPLTVHEMARLLEWERYDPRRLRAALEAAVKARTLRRIGKTRYQWVRDAERPTGARPGRVAVAGEVAGRYTRVRAGFGFVEVLGRAAARYPRDVLIPAGREGDAMHGDEVRVAITRRDARTQRAIGAVVAITRRAHAELIGILQRQGRRWCVVPVDERLPILELIGAAQPRAADAGLAARVRLLPSPPAPHGACAALDAVLGPADDPEVQFLAIASEHGLRIEFPPAVRAEAEALPADPAAAEIAGREDLRHLPFVTIDGETARDFDDAVCLAPRRGGGTCLWVAIADVAHYVRPGSALDAEAAVRGTSVYFPDRAIPMLPPQLSTQLCSLLPERDRLVVVAELHHDRTGKRQRVRCYRAVIRSRARLTYMKVAAVLSDAVTAEIDGWRTELGPQLLEQLQHMRRLMQTLHRARVRAGSLDLDLPEALVDLSEAGRSIGVRLAPRNDAHRLIEEFMLEANRAVAAWLRDEAIPIPYRIHEPPAPADIDELNAQLAAFGFRVEYEDDVSPADVQRLLDRLEGHRLGRLLSRQILRALRQARYSPENVGHFGLAFPIYCHFTSPIRRYPDLLVHRQLGRVLDGLAESARADAERIEVESVRSSEAEREAVEAERAMLDLRKAEFMLGHLLEPEPATVVAAISSGLFVELDAYPIEGLVRADTLPDEPYVYIERERALRGLHSKQRFRLGDRVVVEATNASPQRRQVDFALLRRLPNGAPRDDAEARRPTRRRRALTPRARRR